MLGEGYGKPVVGADLAQKRGGRAEPLVGGVHARVLGRGMRLVAEPLRVNEREAVAWLVRGATGRARESERRAAARQNFRPLRFSVPQLEQVILGLSVLALARAGEADEATRGADEHLAAVQDEEGASVGPDPARVAEHRVDVRPGWVVAVEGAAVVAGSTVRM